MMGLHFLGKVRFQMLVTHLIEKIFHNWKKAHRKLGGKPQKRSCLENIQKRFLMLGTNITDVVSHAGNRVSHTGDKPYRQVFSC